jgi:hypothetical protein
MNLLARENQVMPWRIEDEMKRLGDGQTFQGLKMPSSRPGAW